MTPRPRSLSCAAALVVGSLLLGSTAGAWADDVAVEPAAATSPGVYVVTLKAPPAGAYDGGWAGLPATRPMDGQRFDRTRASVTAYREALLRRQEQVLGQVGDPAVLYHYTTALNGFAATLDSGQVRRLRAMPGVALVERSVKQHIDRTAAPVVGSSTRDLLGLEGPRGLWARHGGPERAGAGTVIGVVDTGIWPENPSFTGLPQRTPGTAPALPGFHGACAEAEEWTPQNCTDKVVSARWFVNGFGEENAATAEYLSPRDGTGHGSHVASTAAGDYGVRVEVDEERFGTTSGMAPAARIAVYKACWTAPDPADDGCTTADTVAAVDSAVADGVDVLNYSVSGSDRRDDSVERAFLGAASAGVFVAASAGNQGRSGPVGHVAPWVTTVAASTHHVFEGAVRLGDGRAEVGAMISGTRVGAAPLVLGETVAAPDASPQDARRCLAGSLAADRANGTIVICERGGGARVDKSAAVAAAGGVGMVLANPRPGSTDADVHSVPTVHLDQAASQAVIRYVRRAGGAARASLAPRTRAGGTAPSAAAFSSRGPVRGSDVLKPDLTAPGVSVLGAVAPPSSSGRQWDLLSGTSTSAPHVAGLAALVAGVRRDWSPARIKSAMMTTATDLRGRHSALLQGAGQVDPAGFLDPGLVFDTTPGAWRAVAAGRTRARDLNAPSLAIDNLVGPTDVNRRITNVSNRAESYSVRVRGLAGVDVQAFPAAVRLAPGESRTIRLRVSARPTATVDRYVTGSVVWSGERHTVRIPVSVRPTVVAAPERVDADTSRSSVVVRGRSGNGRTVRLRSTGLVPARTAPVRLTAGSFDVSAPEADEDTRERTVEIPANTELARFRTEGADSRDDIDLYVYRDGELIDSSNDASSSAEVTLSHPEPGRYQVFVHARRVAEDSGEDTFGESPAVEGELLTWVVPERGGNQVELSTDAVGSQAGERFRYSASWDEDLDPSKHWLGAVEYDGTDRRTLVEVEPTTPDDD